MGALRHVGITFEQVGIGRSVGLREIDAGHLRAFADQVDRDFEVVLRDRSQFGHRLGVVEVDFGGTHQDPVAARGTRRGRVGGRADELDRFVAGVRREGVARDGRGLHLLVARTEDGLRHARIAALRLLAVRHRLPALLVGEARAVGHEVVVHEAAREARAAELDVVGHRVRDAEGFVVAAAEHHLAGLGVLRVEKFAVGFRSLLVEIEGRVGDELLGRGGRLPEVFVGVGHAVILAERPLVERCAAGVGQRGPFRHAGVAALPRARKVSGREVEIFQHAVHHVAAVVARLVDVGVGRAEHVVVIGHIAVGAHFEEVEVGAEEPGHGLVFGGQRSVGTLVEVFEQVVDPAQCAERPGLRGGVAAAGDVVAQPVVDLVVGVVDADVGRFEVVVVELVAPQGEIGLVLEILFGRKLVFGEHRQVAAADAQCDGSES